MVNLVIKENEKNIKPCKPQPERKRYNFGYKPDMSDIRLEVMSGHSPICNEQTSRSALPRSGANNQALQPIVEQPNAWGSMFKDRDTFVEMHLM